MHTHVHTVWRSGVFLKTTEIDRAQTCVLSSHVCIRGKKKKKRMICRMKRCQCETVLLLLLLLLWCSASQHRQGQRVHRAWVSILKGKKRSIVTSLHFICRSKAFSKIKIKTHGSFLLPGSRFPAMKPADYYYQWGRSQDWHQEAGGCSQSISPFICFGNQRV